MVTLALVLFLGSMIVAAIGTYAAKKFATRLGLMDAPGHRKVHTVATPRNGGIGIFWGIAVPLLAGLIAVQYFITYPDKAPDFVALHLAGLKAHWSLALLMLVCTFATHFVGLLDDRKPMNPWPKLLAQLAIAATLVLVGESVAPGAFRTLTLVDAWFPGAWLISAGLTILWITAITNAFNFLDNMDGLSAGVAFICALMFLIAAILSGQWFICALLVIFMGSVLGFLFFNFPPASIFMGDGGSMVLGFFLSALTIRTTYLPTDSDATLANRWYSLLAPVIILSVPLYDLVIVSVLRIARGRSPMTGDTNHFSHRLTRHGFTKRGAVMVIYAVSFAIGISAPLLTRADNMSALLIIGQVVAILVVIGILERVGDHTI